MNSIFPGRTSPPEIFRSADIAEILRAKYIQQQAEKLREGKPSQVSKLWSNHFQSVTEFNFHLWRNGGRYTSAMETIRRRLRLPTIRTE